MNRTLRVLHVEDQERDVALLTRYLTRAGYELISDRVDTPAAMKDALQTRQWDVILCDYSMPHFSALSALALLKEMEVDLPFIIISGTIGEAVAVEAMRAGAHDYLMKDNLVRLGPAIERELHEAENRRARRRADQALAVKNEELAAMTQQLWQASKLATMGELAASIAHELNNPLSTIALRAEVLAEQFGQDKAHRESAEIILQEVERMAKLVDNLLNFSRRSHRQVSTVNAAEEISNSVNFIAYYLRNRNVKVVMEFEEDLPTIQADRQQLRQLFLNLLTNAADAMPGGGTLIAHAGATELKGRRAVLIEFSDSGVGISPENLEEVWDSFFTTKPEGKGTGLGLAICRRIVEEHGGVITIDSKVAEGTSVRVRLPATIKGTTQIEPEEFFGANERFAASGGSAMSFLAG